MALRIFEKLKKTAKDEKLDEKRDQISLSISQDQKMLGSLKDDKKTVLSEIEELKTEKEKHDKLADQAKTAVIDQQSVLSNVKDDVSEYQNMLSDFKSQFEAKKKAEEIELQKLAEKVQTAKELLQGLENQKVEKNTIIRNLDGQLVSFNNETAALESSLASLHAAQNKAKEDLDAIGVELENVKKQIEELEAEKEKYSNLKSQLSALEVKVDGEQAKLSDLLQEKAMIKNGIEKEKNELKEQEEFLDEEKKRIANSSQALGFREAKLIKKVASLQKFAAEAGITIDLNI